jgi:rhomboid family GlyGly-CTERM serine protease
MKPKYPIETGIFVGLLVSLNLMSPASIALTPAALFGGEIWRWFTFPWAHLSFYHLVLDATAFLCLYNQLRCGTGARLLHLGFCILLSGLMPIALEPRLDIIGLRGLSGVAHGFLVITAIESISEGSRFGLVMLAGVLAKSVFEQLSGTVLFAEYHLGNVGVPVPSCHLGGAIGGLLSSIWAVEHRLRIRESSSSNPSFPAEGQHDPQRQHLLIRSDFGRRRGNSHSREILR